MVDDIGDEWQVGPHEASGGQGGDQHGGAEREEEEQKSWLSQKNFFMLTQFDSFDNFHFLISPVDFLKLVDFASADQDPRG